ncbi:TPR-like protein [Neoconidiobolus thromboides FSU 785]|nr:TPR-like protein [Neoconidiobolus thromboides FSU 785]
MESNPSIVTTTSESWIDKLKNQDWKFYAGIVTTVALAGLGVSALYYSTRPPSDKKNKIKGKKKDKLDTVYEPLLEEVIPTPTLKEGNLEEFKLAYTMKSDEINSLSLQQKESYSQVLKEGGNNLFREKKIKSAISTYTKALEFALNPIFYANRAACHANLDNHQQTIEDCSNAVKLDNKYIKAYARRAHAFEALEHTREALDDYVTVYVLSKATNLQAKESASKAIDLIAEREAELLYKDKTPGVPSTSLIISFFNAFGMDAQESIEVKEKADEIYLSAINNLKNRNYESAYEQLQQYITSGTTYKNEAIVYRSAYYFLMQMYDEAINDIDNVLLNDPKNIRCYILKSYLVLERGHYDEAIKLILEAKEIEPRNKNVIYQLAQLLFASGDCDGSVELYKLALEIDPNYLLAYIQLGVAYFKAGQQEESRKIYDQLILTHKNSAEAHNYYAEMLLTLGDFDKVNEELNKSIELDDKYPLPLINKAIIHIDHGQYQEANHFLLKAVELDPRSDLVQASLAQTYAYLYQTREAAETYQACIEHARSQYEAKLFICYKESCLALLRFIENHPDLTEYIKELFLNNFSKESKYI